MSFMLGLHVNGQMVVTKRAPRKRICSPGTRWLWVLRSLSQAGSFKTAISFHFGVH
jgi:hypothetical protein